MTREEAVNKNLDLSFEFDRYLFEHPKFAERIPNNAVVVLLPEYDQELWEYNLQVAKKNREPDQPLVLVKTPDGKEFVWAEMDDFEKEIELTRQNEEVMKFLDERSKETKTYSLAQVKQALGIE